MRASSLPIGRVRSSSTFGVGAYLAMTTDADPFSIPGWYAYAERDADPYWCGVSSAGKQKPNAAKQECRLDRKSRAVSSGTFTSRPPLVHGRREPPVTTS